MTTFSDINERNTRFWNLQSHISNAYVAEAKTPQEALEADERAKREALIPYLRDQLAIERTRRHYSHETAPKVIISVSSPLPDPVIVAPVEQIAAAPEKKKAGRKPDESEQTKARRDIILGIPKNVRGVRYAEAMRDADIKIPKYLRDRECPVDYVAAYRIAKWRKAIQDERCRVWKWHLAQQHSS